MKKFLLVASIIAFSAGGLVAQSPESGSKADKRAKLERLFLLGQDSKSQSARTGVTETWETFPAESLPAGKVVDQTETAKLEPGNYTDQTLYIAGNFVVTNSGPNKSVLRFVDAKTPLRIIAEYPATRPAPKTGTKVSVNASGGLLVRSVVRTSDGQLQLIAREIARP